MSDRQEAMELLEDGAVSVTDGGLEVLDQLLEHLSQNLKLNLTIRGEHILSNGLVGWKHAIEGRGVVSAQDASSLFELTLADVLSSELGEELVENLLVLLLCNRETLIPASILSENLETRKVTALNNLGNLVAGDVGLLLALIDLLKEDLLHLHGAYLLSAFHGSVPLLDLKIGIYRLIVHEARFEDFSC